MLSSLASSLYNLATPNKFWKGMKIMFIAKCLLVILTFILLFIARIKNYNKKTDSANLLFTIATILGIASCILLFIDNINIFNLPKIALFISICLCIVFDEYDERDGILDSFLSSVFAIGFIVTMVLLLITFIIFMFSFKQCETPEIETTSCKIICAKDNSLVDGSIIGSIHHIYGSVSEKFVYQFYYYNEDGKPEPGRIPAESTELNFIEEGEEPYLETIVTTTYEINRVMNPKIRFSEKTETTYNLYIPRSAITDVYELDAE